MTEDERDAAAYAADIGAARDRLIAFASGCSEAQWRAAPLDGDPRPVAVVVDHVADSYEYLAGFIRQILAGQAACDMMLGDCLWHVYAMIGKLHRRVYLLSCGGPAR